MATQDITPVQPQLEPPLPMSDREQAPLDQEVHEDVPPADDDEELDFTRTPFEDDILEDQKDLERVKEASRVTGEALYVSNRNP